MRPTIELDPHALRANAAAWRAHAGVPLRAVVKADGYGWGFATMVRALDGVVDGFVVADLDEFVRVRALTTKPVAVLGDVPTAELGRVLDAGGLPNVSSADGVVACAAWSRRSGRRARVRVGVRHALGWSGVAPDEADALAPVLASAPVDVEAWTHLTEPSAYDEQRDAFAAAVRRLRAGGVRIVETDVESTQPLAGAAATGDSVRIGVGLFGVRYAALPALRCAISVSAPVVQRLPAKGQRVAYGAVRAPDDGILAIVRCGYGDGFPRSTWPERGMLAVGMQYAIVTCVSGCEESSVKLVDAQTDLDRLAATSGIGAHELVVRLGQGRAQHAHPLAGSR